MANFGVLDNLAMIQNYDSFTPKSIGFFSLFEQLPTHQVEKAFFATDLGQLYKAIPFQELARQVPVPPRQRSGLGRKAWLTVEGGIALLVLKHYLGVSDHMVINRLNRDWSMRLFCGLPLEGRMIRDMNLVSRWRVYLSRSLSTDHMQRILVNHWKPYMAETHVGMMDATVYESRIGYPTDVKLLWESCSWIYKQSLQLCVRNRIRKPRFNFQGQQDRFLAYQRRRKRSRRKEKRLRQGLVKFLGRLLERFDQLSEQVNVPLTSEHDRTRLKTIRRLYYQQREHVEHPGKKIQDRIVSLHKPHVRPIIRGKETKAVEFGAKVHLLQVNGINFIEHLSYDAFNEGTRLKQTIWLHQSYFGACHQIAADKIYATNENRKYCKKNDIATCFVQKGRQGHYGDQASVLRKELGRQRATVLEGSFGNEKNHYLLNKIRARSQPTEILWIFLGVMTCNAMLISRRIAKRKNKSKAA
jgi:transposase, IS5 family